MPRYSRKSKRRSADNLDLIEHVRTGTCFGCLIDPPDHYDDDVREGWAIYGAIVMRDWIREEPGTRPWAWWEFDAPEPRRRERADGKPHPFDYAPRKLGIAKSNREDYWRRAYKLHFGLPGLLIFPHDKDIYD